MTTLPKGAFRIVLLGVPEEAQAAVTQSVQETFTLSKTMAGKIAKAAPIVLLNQLEKDDAERLRSALEGVVKAGGNLQVEAVGARKLPVISWPAPPCIDGVDLATVLENLKKASDVRVEIPCPCCGKTLTLTLSHSGGCQGNTQAVAATATATAAPAAATAPAPAAASPAKTGAEAAAPAAEVKKQAPAAQAPATPQAPLKPAPAPQPTKEAKEASRKKIEEDADALFDGITPLSPFSADHMVGSLEDFETGLINLYEVEEGLEKQEKIGRKKGKDSS